MALIFRARVIVSQKILLTAFPPHQNPPCFPSLLPQTLYIYLPTSKLEDYTPVLLDRTGWGGGSPVANGISLT